MRDDAYKPHPKPKALDSFRIAAAELIESERDRGASLETLATKLGCRRQDVKVLLYRIRSGELDRVGFNMIARIIEALGREIRFEFIPTREREREAA